MAKGDPAAAERKRLEKKQQAKNKAQRAEAAKAATAKQDTRTLEADIQQLETKAQAGSLSKSEREQLDALRAELGKVKAAKDAYVEEHPEHRKLVYPSRREGHSGPRNGPSGDAKPPRALLGKNGLPRHPERSVYYHPVMNPTGTAPPGMPYREKSPSEWPGASSHPIGSEDEINMPDRDGDASDTDSGLEDIVMPEGPPPPRRGGPISMPAQQPMGAAPAGFGIPGLYYGPPPPLQASFPGIPSLAPPLQASASRPAPPPAATVAAAPAAASAVTITAEPQLRDLKREATSLVPAALRKKQATDKAREKAAAPSLNSA